MIKGKAVKLVGLCVLLAGVGVSHGREVGPEDVAESVARMRAVFKKGGQGVRTTELKALSEELERVGEDTWLREARGQCVGDSGDLCRAVFLFSKMEDRGSNPLVGGLFRQLYFRGVVPSLNVSGLEGVLAVAEGGSGEGVRAAKVKFDIKRCGKLKEELEGGARGVVDKLVELDTRERWRAYQESELVLRSYVLANEVRMSKTLRLEDAERDVAQRSLAGVLEGTRLEAERAKVKAAVAVLRGKRGLWESRCQEEVPCEKVVEEAGKGGAFWKGKSEWLTAGKVDKAASCLMTGMGPTFEAQESLPR